MSIIFGPINSRRFGKSLGIDLSPNTKQCNFDCLYCELKSAKPINSYSNIVSVNEVIDEIKKALKRYKDIDILTLTANGEPTLYPYLNELIDKINGFKGSIKSLILSNSSTIYKKDIQIALSKLDFVKLSLDCATKRCFKRLDRAVDEIDLDTIKKGMLEFSKIYKGNLIIEILFVKGINDNLDEVAKLNEFLVELKPQRVDLSTIDRPPAYDIKPISYDELFKLSLGFSKDLNINIATKQKSNIAKFDYSKEEILQTLSLRPLTLEDIEVLFSNSSKELFYKLLQDGKIKKVKSADIEFFRSSDDKRDSPFTAKE